VQNSGIGAILTKIRNRPGFRPVNFIEGVTVVPDGNGLKGIDGSLLDEKHNKQYQGNE